MATTKRALKIQRGELAATPYCQQFGKDKPTEIATKYLTTDGDDDNIRVAGRNPEEQLYAIENKIVHHYERISIEQYCKLVANWLQLNTKMISVSDYFEDVKNMPFLYTLGEVLDYDSDDIYYVLRERLIKMAAKKQLDGNFVKELLQQDYGWDKNKEALVNMAVSNGNIQFKFGNQAVTQNNENE